MKSPFSGKLLTASIIAASMMAVSPYALAQKAEPAPAPAAKAPPKTAAKPAPSTAGQYKTEVEAKTACGADTVVWANMKSKKYHTTASKDYGKTSKGAYMCEKNAGSSGFKAVKGNKKT